MGDVYAGFDDKLERKVALKVLQPDQRLEEEARERLLREARALSRLDHPNICRIHDYIESGDVDLLVLEYIDGRTLQDVLQEGLSRSEKLRIAMAVAEVLVAAHRAGIVHRDLKPENVMLTRSGEVKVLDFGLARWLKGAARSRSSDRFQAVRLPVRPGNGDPQSSDMTVVMPIEELDDSPSPSRRPDLATAIGITLGTPLFMSPEQARGETLTPASDMFSFGLLLQTLFTGEDPHPPDLTAREVIIRVARGQTRAVTGAPGDVTALINSLKQFAPPDRPTAVEAVRRLRYLADKPQRIARRALVAAVVAILLIGAWRYTVDLRRERATAVAARAQAEDLIEFMLGDLRGKLRKVGRLEILDDVGKRAVEYVDALDPETMTGDELARTAKALNQLGEVREEQGKTPEAMDLFQRSLRLADGALKREPKNPRVLLVHGAAHFFLGNSLRLQGKNDEALGHMLAYMKDGDALAALDPKNREYQLERAYGHSGVALILEAKNQPKDALGHYEVSRAVKEELARRAPGDVEAQAELARAYNKVGYALYNLGELRQARDRFEREMAIYRRLSARDPKDTDLLSRLALSMAFVGLVYDATGEDDRALALFREQLEIDKQLAARDPENVSWQRGVAATTMNVAAALAKKGQLDAARPMFQEARSTIRKAIELAPTRKGLVTDAAGVDIEYAKAIGRAGEVAAAREILSGVLDAMQPRLPDRAAALMVARAAYAYGDLVWEIDPALSGQMLARAESALAPHISAITNVVTLELWTRVQIGRGHGGEARALIARLRRTGYATAELETLCRERGC